MRLALAFFFVWLLALPVAAQPVEVGIADTGAVKLGAAAVACDVSMEGSIRYNAATNAIDLCDDSPAWVTIGPGGTVAAETIPINDLTDAYTIYDAGTNSNFIMGRTGAAALTAGAVQNMFIGELAGATTANSTAATDYNMAIGLRALRDLTSGSGNLAVGLDALKVATTGTSNTAVGIWALSANTANENTALGNSALGVNTSGTRNTALGTWAMSSNLTGNDNVGIGNSALGSMTAGGNNIAIGRWALVNNASNNNIAIGFQALQANTTVGLNTAVGHQAMYANTVGTQNAAFGLWALYENVAKSRNTAVGYEALRYADSTASASNSNNTALGYEALMGSATPANNTGINNTALGASALVSTTTGSSNVGVGNSPLWSNTAGSANVAIGQSALLQSTTSFGQVAIGHEALYTAATASGNTAVGYQALRLNTANDNTALGYGALDVTTTGGSNVAVGDSALGANISGTSNVAIGSGALIANTTSSGNVAIGYGALFTAATATGNTAVGYQALRLNQSGGLENTALGYSALTANTTGDFNTAVGMSALSAGTTGLRNTALGSHAMEYGPTVGDNTAVGYAALNENDSTGNVAVGVNALDLGNGASNTAIGYQAGMGVTGNAKNGDVFVGYQAGVAITTGSNNVFVGYTAGSGVTTGATNTIFGFQAGSGLTTGSSNIIIGANANLPSAAATSQLDIGDTIYADLTNDYVSIGGTTPVSKFVVAPAATQTIAATNTITANSCGSIKPIDAASSVTTNTTDTFTAPTASYNGCCMDVVNVDAADTITLDFNAKFITASGADVALAPGDATRVCATATTWYQTEDKGPGTADSIDSLTDAVYDAATGHNLRLGANTALFAGAASNIFIGDTAGSAGTNASTDNNIAIGYVALDALTTGHENIAIGTDALGGNTTGIGQIAIGYQALLTTATNTTGANIAIGYQALTLDASDGLYNVAIGYRALDANTSGDYNIAIGTEALGSGNGSSNTAIGYRALTASTGSQNTAVGESAMLSNTGGNNNVAMGMNALNDNFTGDSNTAIGTEALRANTVSNNTAVGYHSLYVNTLGGTNTALGSAAGDSITTGAGNIVIGYNVDTSAVGASSELNIGDTIYGDLANDRIRIGGSGAVTTGPLIAAPPATQTIAATNTITANSCGSIKPIDAASSVTTNTTDTFTAPTASYNGCCMDVVNVDAADTITLDFNAKFITAAGGDVALAPGDATRVCATATTWYQTEDKGPATMAIDSLTDAATDYATDHNMFMGSGAGAAIASGGIENLTVGQSSGAAITTGDANVALGYQTLQNVTTGTDNTALGDVALRANTGSYNTAVGADALKSNTSAQFNVAVGAQSLDANTTGQYNIGVGDNTLGVNVSGSQNVAIGSMALGTNTASDNVAVGYFALDVNTSGASNVAIGRDALGANTTSSGQVAIGFEALLTAVTATGNTAIGYRALKLDTGIENTAVGYQAMLNNAGGNRNVAFGKDALATLTGTSDNTAMGYGALTAATGGTNTALGSAAGDSITTGTGNIVIGYNVDTSAVGASSELNIGDTIYGDLANDRIRIGGSGAVTTGPLIAAPPATQTIAATNTITANACGTIKPIDAASSITTNTTDTFTAPTASYNGCCMDVVNVDTTDTITLDFNAKFVTSTGGDIALAPGNSTRVCATSTTWYQPQDKVTGGARLDQITAGTASASIDSTSFGQTWNWNTLAGTSALKLSTTSTAAASGAQKLLEVAMSGANAASNEFTTAASISNTHTGTGANNIGLSVKATGGAANYPLVTYAGGGTNSTILEGLRISNEDTDSAGVDGIGTYMAFSAETETDLTYSEFARIAGVAEDADVNSRDGSLRFYIAGPNAASGAAPTEMMRLDSNGNRVTAPATQTIAATNTITANACGSVKPLDAGSSVTTNTTDTFTAPSAAIAGCCMDVVNVDTTDTITLDFNAKFATSTGGDIALAPGNSTRVCATSAIWYQSQDKVSGGAGARLDQITAANTGATIDNLLNPIVWNWSTLAGGTTALSLNATNAGAVNNTTLAVGNATTGAGYGIQSTLSDSANTGTAIYATNATTANGSGIQGFMTGAGNTGAAGNFLNNGTGSSVNYGVLGQSVSTGAAYGVYGRESGAANTGYGVYGTNTSTAGTGYGVYSSGRFAAVPPNQTIASAAGAEYTTAIIAPPIIILTGSVAVTTQMDGTIVYPPTINSAGTPAVTSATAMTITGPPTATGTATITNAYGLKIDTAASAATNAYGLYVAAPTGATNNYAAVFPTGNVGIGTASPSNKLSLAFGTSDGIKLTGSGTTSWRLGQDAAADDWQFRVNWVLGSSGQDDNTKNGWAFRLGPSTDDFAIYKEVAGTATAPQLLSLSSPGAATTANLYINGNVGIGTTAPNYGLDVQAMSGGTKVASFRRQSGYFPVTVASYTNWGMIGFNIYEDSGDHYDISDYGATIELLSGDVAITTAPSGSAGAAATMTQRLIVKNNGNVGIGDTTPDHKLDVAGNIGLDASSYINFGDTDGTGGYGIRDNAGAIQCKNSGGAWGSCGTGGGGTPGGSTTQVQFNDAGSFGGDAGMTYNKTTDALTVNGSVTYGLTTGLSAATNSFIAGATTQIQFNNAGAFGASSALTWDNASNLLTIGGHIANSAAGTPTVATCGTSPPAVVGNDTRGKITYGTGTATKACTMTFATAYATAPYCVVTQYGGITAGAVSVTSTSTTTLVLGWTTAVASVAFHYICMQ